MQKSNLILVVTLLLCFTNKAQTWMLKLSSTIELRTWKLTSTAEKTEKALGGAAIILYKDKTLITQTISDANGNFEIDIPAKGEFILTIGFSACNTKKFHVTTNGVPEDVGKTNYKPTINITGFIMSKPLKGVDYIGLNEPLVKVEYKTAGQNFDKDQTVTNQGLEILSKIYDAENTIIEKFCSANKAGDEALKKHNCDLAIDYYKKAINILPDEKYPHEQKIKAEQCIKDQKQKEENLAQQKAEKEAAIKAENEKLIAEKNAKDKAAKTNTNTEIISTNSSTKTVESEQTTTNKSDNVYKMPKAIGANKYKEKVSHANDCFKTKRYNEAKIAYEEALKEKPNDVYSINKINECDKLLNAK